MSIENLKASQRVCLVKKHVRGNINLTVGKEYTVIAGAGDADPVCGDYVYPSGMVIADDTGELIYCAVPIGIRGYWELVDENQ